MAKPAQQERIRVSTMGDVVCAFTQMLGFVPTRSIGVLCMHAPRGRLGLAMRFDLTLADDPDRFAAAVGERVRFAGADGAFVIVFADEPPSGDGLPFAELVKPVEAAIGDRLVEMLLVVGDRWWSYLCEDPGRCDQQSGAVDWRSPGATSLTAAYAMVGQGVLPSRDAVIASIAFNGGSEEQAAMRRLLESARSRLATQSQPVRRAAVRSLLSRLSAASHEPRAGIDDRDAAELAALCEDVVVRDEVLVRARKTRRRSTVLRVLTAVARRIPPPDDAPVCATLAWVAYANGDGVVANVALDRALGSRPDYSLGLLLADAIERQLPPALLEEVMHEAARDLQRRQ